MPHHAQPLAEKLITTKAAGRLLVGILPGCRTPEQWAAKLSAHRYTPRSAYFCACVSYGGRCLYRPTDLRELAERLKSIEPPKPVAPTPVLRAEMPSDDRVVRIDVAGLPPEFIARLVEGLDKFRSKASVTTKNEAAE